MNTNDESHSVTGRVAFLLHRFILSVKFVDTYIVINLHEETDMTGLTVEEKAQALVYAKNGADFMFVPSANLCNMIATGRVETEHLNKVLVSILLKKKPIRMDTGTITRYCKGTLDFKNTWLLNHGDVQVVSPRYKRPEIVKNDDDPNYGGCPVPSNENNLEENEDE